jgi:hypothetical protein
MEEDSKYESNAGYIAKALSLKQNKAKQKQKS